jgi:ribonuclease HI
MDGASGSTIAQGLAAASAPAPAPAPAPARVSACMRVYTYGRLMGAGVRRRLGGYAYAPDAESPAGLPAGAYWTSSGRITNQLMELAAAFEGLKAIERFFEASLGSLGSGVAAVLVTTSHYVMSCMTQWLPRWERTGWITKQQRVVQNCDVLKQMAAIADRFKVRFERVDAGLAADAQGQGPAAELQQLDPDPDTDRGGGGGGGGGGLARVKQMVDHVLHDALHAGCSKRHNVMCVWSG